MTTMGLYFQSAGRPLLAGCLLVLSLGAAGCGVPKGDVSGKVSYKGKPLVYGSVLLIGADSKPRTTWIQQDGTYHFEEVPAGQAKLAVFSPDPDKQLEEMKMFPKDKRGPKDKMGPKDKLREKMLERQRPVAPQLPAVDRKKWFPIPTEYGDVDHSGLQITIDRGPNTYNIEMK